MMYIYIVYTRYESHLADLIFLDQVKSIFTRCQVRIKTEVSHDHHRQMSPHGQDGVQHQIIEKIKLFSINRLFRQEV